MVVTGLHLIVHGRVQGVGYRAWAAGTARRLGLDGWVRNRTDGTVELVVAGESEKLTQMRQECERGPLAARVARIDETAWYEAVAEGFIQRATE